MHNRLASRLISSREARVMVMACGVRGCVVWACRTEESVAVRRRRGALLCVSRVICRLSSVAVCAC